MGVDRRGPTDMERRLGPSFDRGPPPGPPGPAVRSAAVAVQKEPAIDREKLGAHHHLEEYVARGQEPKDEVQMYTWMDATLRELCDLVKEVHPAARRPHAWLSFAFVYPDRRGRNVMRQVGQVHSTRFGEDDAKTLKQLSFQTGDFLDVAIRG
eukprot:scaffold2.g6996.t1